MTENPRQQPIGSVSGTAADAAALIATFYGGRDQAPIQMLHERLYQSLAAAPNSGPAGDKWENLADGTFGRRFDPPWRAAHDTTVVQVALNAPAGAAEAWRAMRHRLENVLEAKDLDGVWGYTLVYQAVLKQGIEADAALKGMLPVFRRLRSSGDVEPLAQADVSGGRVWLVDVPDRGDGFAAGTVYVALGPPDGEEALLDVFYGPAALLLAPDIIAHKGYYEMRQYLGGDLERRYAESIEYLNETTDDLLQDLERREVKGDKLDELFRTYNRLLPVVSGLKELRTGLLQQLANYDWWRTHIESNEVIDFHRDQLEMASLELKLKAEPLQDALGIADKAISVAQVLADRARDALHRQIEQAQERRQQRITFVVAVVGLALAVPEMVDRRAARALLRLVVPELVVPEPPSTAVLMLLGTQLLIMVVVALLVALVIVLVNKWRGK